MSDAVLARWSAKGLHPIMLPTGTRVKVRIPSPEAIVGKLPSDLRRLALGAAVGQTSVAQGASEEELEQFVAFTTHLACETLREVWDEESDSWQPVSLSPEELRALELPEEDLEALMQIAARARTPAQVDARSRAELKLLDATQAERIQREEAAGTVTAFAPFRDQPGRAADGPDGKPVRPKPRARVSRDQRPAAGAAGR